MKRILVLGGGRHGRVVASDLAGDFAVTVADIQRREVPNTKTIVADLSDPRHLQKLLVDHDLSVGVLPARLGFLAAQAAIAVKRHHVDVAFFPEDVGLLDQQARQAGISLLLGCGLAPGLSNLVVGCAVSQKKPRAVHIQVGGVAADRTRPYGYVITWAVEDLLDDYRRPARIMCNGQLTTAPALSGLEQIDIAGVGTMEAFYTDGLRTLLDLHVPEMSEKTLRWPGHAEQVRPLAVSGRLLPELRAKCGDGDDLVVLRIQVDDQTMTLVERPRDGLSAMSRTTALPCAAFARWVATGQMQETGVIAPEHLGKNPKAYKFILDAIAKHGVVLTPKYPFLP